MGKHPTLEDLNLTEAQKKANPHLFPEYQEKPAVPLAHTCSKIEVALEKELQAQVEAWLYHRGYGRRSKTGIVADKKPRRGWQIHLFMAKKNPLLLDILLLGNDGRFTEFELKRPGGTYSSEGQRILCEEHGFPKFETFEEVIEHVNNWENGISLQNAVEPADTEDTGTAVEE